MIWLIPAVYMIEWLLYAFVPDTWGFMLGTKYLMVAVMAGILFDYSHGKSLLIRSLIALFAVDSSVDFIRYMAWQILSIDIDFSIYEAVIFMIWFLFISFRPYEYRSDPMNSENINLLILKPKRPFDILKGLFGFPAASICIASCGSIWSFRRKSGLFEERNYRYSPDHIVINTGVSCTDKMLIELDALAGTKRWPGIKCVWVIRNILNQLGDKYRIKSWFDYIPGVYFLKIIKQKQKYIL